MKKAPVPEHLAKTYTLLDKAGEILTKSILAYSGGKDSVVLAHILSTRYGIRNAICDNSFWFDQHQLDADALATSFDLKVKYVDRFGDKYVLERPEWLFPAREAMGALYGKRQQRTVKEHALNAGIPLIAYGRRIQENSVPSPMYRTKDGLQHIHPLRHWTHEQIWEHFREYAIKVPSIYRDPIGQLWGGTPWNFIVPDEVRNTQHEPGIYRIVNNVHIPVRPSDKDIASYLIQNFCPSTYTRLVSLGIIPA